MRKQLRKGLLIQLSVLLVLSGCTGSGKSVDTGADIVLLEPVGAVGSYETAAYRNIYDAVTYSGGVYPVVTEYAYDTTQKFAGYDVLPGEEVSAGEILLAADLQAMDESIADMQESLEKKQAAHLEYVEELQEDIEKATEETQYRKEFLDCLSEENQDALYVRIQGNYRMAVYNEEMLRKELEQNTQLFELEYAYESERLAQLIAERERAILRAAQNGTVVAAGFYAQGDTMQENASVIAVADLEEKLLKCDYISPSQIAKAGEVYAVIDGRKYEVLYQKMDSDEYAALTATGEQLYSTFLFVDDTTDVEIGDYAAVVLVMNSREDVVSVSRSAVHKDETGNYVYLYSNGEKVYTPVKTGLSDGTYIEVVSGLSAGDKVMVESKQQYGSRTAELEPGTFSAAFGARGYLYYPKEYYVINEIEYGTVYMQECMVSRYQMVQAGDVLATVRVEGENAQLIKLQTQLARMEERLSDYQLQWAEENQSRDYTNETKAEKEAWADRQKTYDKEVADRMEKMEELRTMIEDMQTDYATCRIVAGQSGIVTWVCDYEKEEVLPKDCKIASIAEMDTVYMMVENKNQALSYGMDVNVSYLDLDDEENTIHTSGTVVNLANPGLSSTLQSDYAIIRITEPVGDLVTTYTDERGEWRRRELKVTATVSEMENVLLVPKDAVTDVNGHLYVNVLQEDGSIVTTSFIAGGNDMFHYWVIDGLEEGMTICYE